MNVRELIEKLETFDQSLPVLFYEEGWYNEIKRVNHKPVSEPYCAECPELDRIESVVLSIL